MKKALLLGIASVITLGLASCGSDGKTPYIGDNGNWWIDSSDLGVPARGEDGKDGKDGKDGSDGKDGVDGKDGKDGSNGKDGQDGQIVTVVSVEKTDTTGTKDTYTITFSDGSTSAFTVTNGETITVSSIEKTESTGLVDVYTITFSNGATHTFSVTNGKDGADLTVISISHSATEGSIDTYTITYSDGSTYNFAVSNGADGLTPYIGSNGNWWIGEEDTGVLADWERANNVPLTFWSNGLQYKTMTIGGKSGFVVTGWDIDDDDLYPLADGYTFEELTDFYDTVELGRESPHVVIPNYIGSVPVIGIAPEAHLNFANITLSKNTIYIGNKAFQGCKYLRNIDFNGCSIKSIPEYCFEGTSITHIDIPSSVTHVFRYAFSGLSLDSFDFSNIKYIGDGAFSAFRPSFVYLPKAVEYVGSQAFPYAKVYLQHEAKPTSWASVITSTDKYLADVPTNCEIEGDYLYSVKEGVATIHQYLGTERDITVPSTIGDYPVQIIGQGFASVFPNESVASKQWLETYRKTGKLYAVNQADIIRLPEGIKEIQHWAFFSPNEMVLIPSSIERISETLFEGFDADIDDNDDLDPADPAFGTFASERYFVFEGNDLPQIIDEYNDTIDSGYTKEEVMTEEEYRISFGVNFGSLEFDDNFCYQNEGLTYSLFAYLGLRLKNIVVPSTFNDKNVTTILSNAIGAESYVDTITVGSNVERIKPRAIACYDLDWVYIPSSVAVINAYGVYGGSIKENIYVERNEKPDDWDSNWTNLTDKILYAIGEVKTNAFFRYSVKNNAVSLVKYLGSSANVLIPSEIDGLPVIDIKTGFLRSSDAMSINVPSSITKISANAFVNTGSRTFTFYCQAQAKPDDWDSNCVSGYANYNWNQFEGFDYRFSGDYAYMISGQTARLLAYAGQDKEIRVPRMIENLTVTSIKTYCFLLTKSTTVYIPVEIATLESRSFALRYTGYACYFKCEPESKPGGWNYYCWSNMYSDSTSYCSASYGQVLDY